MNEELFNEAARSNVLSKKLIDQLQESMTYSSISFINWTIEVLTLIKNRLERGDRISDEVSGEVYTIHSFQKFVKANFSSYITSQVFKEISNPEKIYLPHVRTATVFLWQIPMTIRLTPGFPASVRDFPSYR